METYNQGSEYKEEGVEVLEETSSKKIPPKMLAIGGGIILAGLIVSGGYSLFHANTAKVSKAVTSVVTSKPTPPPYTPAQLDQLRANGYTATEIENYQKGGMSPDFLVKKATDSRQALLQSTYDELKKNAQTTGSPEYQQLISMTWMAGNPVTVSDPSGKFTTTRIKDNIRYVKIPPHGNQLMLKLTLTDGTTSFYATTPQRWVQLKDNGNMIITYDKIAYGINFFITNIQEVPLN